MDVFRYYYLLGIPIKFRGAYYEQNNRKKLKYKHIVDTVVASMYMDEIMVVRLFLSSV